MKASFYTESILYWLARGVSRLACALPAEWNVLLGAAVGRWVGALLPRRRRAALKHLRAAFEDQKSPEELRRIVDRMFANFGRTIMEIARIPAIDRAYVDRWIEPEPEAEERLKTALAKGRGGIILAGHLGNWELMSLFAAIRGYPTLVLVRAQGLPRLNRLLNDFRESRGCTVISKGFPTRRLIEGLRAGRLVGILSDQDGGPRGVLAPYFGRLASTAPGAISLGLSTGAPILPCFILRQRGAVHRVVVEEPIVIPEAGTEAERIQAGITDYLSRLQNRVAEHPEQWLWLHRRWKTCPERRLLILSDEKPGHLNQSRAFAERLEGVWREKKQEDRRLAGWEHHPLVQTRVVRVTYRSRAARWLAAAVASVPFLSRSGGDFWMRRLLAHDCYLALRSAYADIVISCGAGTAPVNLLFSEGIAARTIHITRTDWPSWRRFDLAVIPEHDHLRGGEGGKVLRVTGALTPRVLAEETEQAGWRERFKIHSDRPVGLLLGGQTPGVRFDQAGWEKVLAGLAGLCREGGRELLVTSSRRTPAGVERVLAEQWDGRDGCRVLALVNRKHHPGFAIPSEALRCIFSLASVLVVSGDSISMVSEALGTGKPVVAFLPAAVSGRGKHERFLTRLAADGRLRLADPESLTRMVSEAMAVSGGRAESDNRVEEFLRRWL
ncbi:MAG: hypothetical protein COV76_02605 [Candidatus Omnitrophica bacterium CG11_big_fil_rev_8_21_14_0_20_64_10]|nr:MAG: hypothetical protein COV76_02605 [Candidatus Omnitrophica bacterium CG11_big_fil_rev_8_21_14_0_20_64_10]